MNHLYPIFKQLLLAGGFDALADTVRVCLVGSSYIQADTDQFLSILPGGSIIATSPPLTGLTTNVPSPGVFNANPVLLAAVPAGNTVTGVVMYKDTGFSTNSPLMVWMDTLASGLPIAIVTSGGDIQVNWSTAASRIFSL